MLISTSFKCYYLKTNFIRLKNTLDMNSHIDFELPLLVHPNVFSLWNKVWCWPPILKTCVPLDILTTKFREQLGLNVFDSWPTIQILHPFLAWRGQPTLLLLTLSQLITILFVGCFLVDSIHFPTNIFFLVIIFILVWMWTTKLTFLNPFLYFL
jgi:hypothetical protein